MSRAVRAITAVLAGATGCALEPNPDFYREEFAFAVISDWDGAEDPLRNVVCHIRARPDVALVLGTGGIADHAFVRDALRDGGCAGASLPYFPVVGSEELSAVNPVPAFIDEIAMEDIVGMTAFERGPVRVDGGPSNAYTFAYHGARFTVVDTHDGPTTDAGISPESEQMRWLDALPVAAHERPTFVFGHLPLVRHEYYGQPFEEVWQPGSIEVEALTPRLASKETTAYFHGNDHIPARAIVNASGEPTYVRTPQHYIHEDGSGDITFDVLVDDGDWVEDYDPSSQLWQVGVGLITQGTFGDLEGASFVVTRVTPEGVMFEIHAFGEQFQVRPRDIWTIPR
jgi:hypothetical protein